MEVVASGMDSQRGRSEGGEGMSELAEQKIILDRSCFEESRGNLSRRIMVGGSMVAVAVVLVIVVFFILVGL